MGRCHFCCSDSQSGEDHSQLCQTQRHVYDLTGSARRVIARGRSATSIVEVLVVLDSLADAAGRLVELVREGDSIEVEAPPDLPDILEHFAAVHPDADVTARVWWDVPYKHHAEVRDGVLLVFSGDGTSGDVYGDDEYWCGECDTILRVDSIEVDYS